MVQAMRQMLLVTSMQLAALSVGGFIVYPTQVLQQLKCNDSMIVLDMNTSSWIGSIYGLAGIPVILLPTIMQWKGRKLAYIITLIFGITGWALSLIANSTALLLTSEAFQGLATNSIMPVSCLIMTEMLSPKYRSISLQLFSVSMGLGMIIVGISGRFIHFKTFSIIMLVPIVISAAVSFTWPESPPWHACRGEFDKCEKAFVWLRGTDDSSVSELNQLITAQKAYLAKQRSKQTITLKSLWHQITSRDFYMPSLHIFILQNMLYWSGGDVILVYFMELVEKSTHNQDAVFYSSLVLYTIILMGSIISNFTVRRFKNKTVLLSSTLGVILTLFSACIVTYLQSIGYVAKDSLACMYCLIGFITFNSLGLNSLVFIIGSELMPVKHRGIGGSLCIITNCGLYTMTLKLSPYLIVYIEMWGMFTIFTVNAVLCAIIVWHYVPETKDRTLQELEDYYAYGHFIQRTITKEEPLYTLNMENCQ